MPTIRRRKHPQTRSITAAALAAFKAGDHLTLHRELRLPPWQASPLDAEGACPWRARSAGWQTWPDSVALREGLCHG